MKALDDRRLFAIFGVLLTLALSFLYSSGLRHELIFDDQWITNNPDKLLSHIELSFNFRSLWLASFQAVHQWIGSELYWQRALNIALHIGNTLLLWWLTRNLLLKAALDSDEHEAPLNTDEMPITKAVSMAAVVGVVVWSFNPVAVYAVQYLTQRSTLMATFFLLIALIAFIGVMRAKTLVSKIMSLSGVVLGFLLSILSKEHAAPGVALLLPLYFYWRQPSWRTALRVGVVLLIITCAAAVWMIMRKGWTWGAATEDLVQPFLRQLETMEPGATDRVYQLSVINQAWLFFRYGFLWNIPLPPWLSLDLRPPFPLHWYSMPQLFGVVLFPCAVGTAAWFVIRGRGWLRLCGLVVLLPAILYVVELAYVRIQEPFVLYRSYLWSISLPSLWGMLVYITVKRTSVYVIVAITMATVLGAASFERIQSLRNETSAWADALEKIDLDAPPNAFGRWRAPLNVSKADLLAGRFFDAYRHAQLADKLGAPEGLAKFNMGSAMSELGQPMQAIQLLRRAQKEGFQKPSLWATMAIAYEKMNQNDLALAYYEKALSSGLVGKERIAIFAIAAQLATRMSRLDVAKTYYEGILIEEPRNHVGIFGLAFTQFRQGKLSAAESTFAEAIQVDPRPELFYGRASLYMQAGKLDLAARDIDMALEKDPNNMVYKQTKQKINDMMVQNQSMSHLSNK